MICTNGAKITISVWQSKKWSPSVWQRKEGTHHTNVKIGLLMPTMLNDWWGQDAPWKEVWQKNGYQYRHITSNYWIQNKLLQYWCMVSFVSCGRWLFECGNTTLDGNIAETIPTFNLADTHSTAKFAMLRSSKVPHFVQSIGICLQRLLRNRWQDCSRKKTKVAGLGWHSTRKGHCSPPPPSRIKTEF